METTGKVGGQRWKKGGRGVESRREKKKEYRNLHFFSKHPAKDNLLLSLSESFFANCSQGTLQSIQYGSIEA